MTTSHVPERLRPLYPPCTHTHTCTYMHSHIYTHFKSPGLCFTDLLGKPTDATSDDKSQAGRAPAGVTFINPSTPPPCAILPSTPTPHQLHLFSLSLACGLQYGPALPRRRCIGAHWSLAHIYTQYIYIWETHKHWNTQAHGQAYSPPPPPPLHRPHHPPPCWALAHGEGTCGRAKCVTMPRALSLRQILCLERLTEKQRGSFCCCFPAFRVQQSHPPPPLSAPPPPPGFWPQVTFFLSRRFLPLVAGVGDTTCSSF